jgi:hypothetical protein
MKAKNAFFQGIRGAKNEIKKRDSLRSPSGKKDSWREKPPGKRRGRRIEFLLFLRITYNEKVRGIPAFRSNQSNLRGTEERLALLTNASSQV